MYSTPRSHGRELNEQTSGIRGQGAYPTGSSSGDTGVGTEIESTADVYTLGETAELLGIGRSTAYDLAQRGELEVVKLGGRRLVSPTVLEALLGERPPPPGDLDD